MSSTENAYGYQKKEFPKSILAIGLILLVIGVGLAAVSFAVDNARASFNMIIVFMFVFSVGIGSLFLVALEYLVDAVWSVPFRRLSEIFAAALIIVPVLAIPVLLNLHDVFHWTHHEAVEADKVLKGKEPYLNVPFFIIRFVVITLISWFFYTFITRFSRKQDNNPDQKYTRINIRFSAVFMPVFGIAMTIFAVDWMMSLEPHWFSTIFGVYYFSGTILAALAVLTFAAVNLAEKGYLPGIRKDHYYNFGALLFAFTNFWAYIAFSQFLLIWYANIPEETFWYIHRWEGSWMYISIALIIVRFVVPYAALLSQPSKSNPKNLKVISVWILFAHIFDLYWLIMPNFDHHGIVFGWMEVVFWILGFGVVITVFALAARNKNLLAVGDPKLSRGMEFHL